MGAVLRRRARYEHALSEAERLAGAELQRDDHDARIQRPAAVMWLTDPGALGDLWSSLPHGCRGATVIHQDQPSRTHLSRTLFWIEVALASVAGFLTVLTLFTREWIETVFNVDSDGGDGSLEWFIVVALAVVTVVLAVLARLEWRRTPPVHG